MIAPATFAEVIDSARAGGFAPSKEAGFTSFRATCPKCNAVGSLRIQPTPEGASPADLWCDQCQRIPLARLRRADGTAARMLARVSTTRVVTAPGDTLATTPPDGRAAGPNTGKPIGPTLHTLAPLKPAALHGPIGQYIRAIAADTEASPAGILAATITTIGAMLGRGPHCMIEGGEHHTRFNVLLVGPSSTGRKGTALHHGVTHVIKAVDSDVFERVVSGLSSAEGLITAVRDASPDGEGPNGKGDPGIPDKRLLVKQGEAAGLFKIMEREGNAISPRLREAWDGDSLQVMTRTAPLKATSPHICFVGCITPGELSRSLKAAELHNGLANRFMVFWCERERFLPHGGNTDRPEVAQALELLRRAVITARTIGRVGWTPSGRTWWEQHYPDLSTPAAGGFLGTLLARGAPMVQRLALLFAVLDCNRDRDVVHCEAAHAVWCYCADTWRALYASADALSDRAQRLLVVLNAAGTDGILKSECRMKLGSGNITAADIDAVLNELREAGLARPHRKAGLGRPAEVWVSTRNLSTGRIGLDGSEGATPANILPMPTISTTPPEETPGHWDSILSDAAAIASEEVVE